MKSATGAPSRPVTVQARDVGVIELKVEALGEAEAEEPACRVERRLDHPVELQIRLDLALVEVELGLAPLFRQVAPIPGRDLEIAALAGDDRLQSLLFLPRARYARRPDRLEKIERRLRRPGHRVGETVMRVGFVAQQARALGPEADHLGGDVAIVGRAAVLAARRPGAKGVLPQVAPRRELQERLDARARQRDGIFAGMTALGGEPRGARDEEIRQAVEIAFVEQHQPGLFVRQHVLAERGAEARQPFADRRQARLGLRRRAGAGAGEIEMIALEHPRLFGGKPELVRIGLQARRCG